MQDYIIYVGLLLFSTFMAFVAEKRNSIFCIAMIVLAYTAIAGLRAKSVGADTAMYISLFDRIRAGTSELSVIDEGFKELCRILLSIWDNDAFVLSVVAFATYFFIIFRLWDFRKIASFPFMVFCTYTMHYAFTLNIMRQYLGVAIAFWASRYIFKKQYPIFFALVLIASSIHSSTLLAMALLMFGFVTWKDNNILEKTLMLISTGIVPIALFRIISIEKYTKYFSKVVRTDYLMYVILVFYFILSLFYVNLKSEDKNGNQRLDYEKIAVTIFYAISLGVNFLGTFFRYMNRVGMIFIIFGVVYHGMLVKNSKDKKFFFYSSAVYYLYSFVTVWMANSHSQLPYLFFWQ